MLAIRNTILISITHKHRKDRMYKCIKCDKQYDQKKTLKEHIDHAHQRIECNVCGANFRDKSCLMKHNEARHMDP